MLEDPGFLKDQLITYLGNKRALLGFLDTALRDLWPRGPQGTLRILDVFSGSGVVARWFKAWAADLWTNDLEAYSAVINRCYLCNRQDFPTEAYETAAARLHARLDALDTPGALQEQAGGVFSRHYAPRDDGSIQAGERVFFTRRNALFLDAARMAIGELDASLQPFFLGPLLAEASIHANTSGVFKGFYKDRSGIGRWGGAHGNALSRIQGPIRLHRPVLSAFSCRSRVCTQDANQLARELRATGEQFDLAYLDPPYNQHPYGSNYFMLNLLVNYREPQSLSTVSGIPSDWNRSAYNRRADALESLRDLISNLPSRLILVSFNNEGFISQQAMEECLGSFGQVTTLAQPYPAFRGSRNLHKRAKAVSEFIFILVKSGL